MDAKTLYAKLSAVPQPIKTWLGSDSIIAEIEKSEDQFTLPFGASATIAKLIQRIQIKDIGPEYFSGTLADELHLDKSKAVHITEEIKKEIFSPLRKDFLSYGIDIDRLDKFQMPAPNSSSGNDTPKIIQEAEATIPQPLGSKGISTGGAATVPKPIQNPTPMQTTADIGRPKTNSAASMVAPPTPPAEPAPMMLHHDDAFTVPEKNAAFTLSKPNGGAQMDLVAAKPTAAPRPAVLELGNTPRPATINPPTNSAPRATQYTFRQPLSSISTASTGPRTVSQIVPPGATAAAPARIPAPAPSAATLAPAATAPKAPAVPTPPRPPVAPFSVPSLVPVPTMGMQLPKPPVPPRPAQAPASQPAGQIPSSQPPVPPAPPQAKQPQPSQNNSVPIVRNFS
jgi:hypothetical protein